MRFIPKFCGRTQAGTKHFFLNFFFESVYFKNCYFQFVVGLTIFDNYSSAYFTIVQFHLFCPEFFLLKLKILLFLRDFLMLNYDWLKLNFHHSLSSSQKKPPN